MSTPVDFSKIGRAPVDFSKIGRAPVDFSKIGRAPVDFSKIGRAAAEAEDMTVSKTFERELPAAGIAFVRLLSYIELGRHEARPGSGYKPALKVIIVFELSHKKHLIDTESGGKVPQTMMVRINKGSTTKSGFRKLFNVMNNAYDKKFNHFSQMIGLPFLAEVFHNTTGEGDKAKTYANLDLDGAWSLRKPESIDPLTEVATTVPIPELHGTPQLFLWESPAITDEVLPQLWDALYIEGTREVEDKDTKEKKEVSKNWIQETIQNNLEWEGSTTQALTQEHITLEDHEGDSVESIMAEKVEQAEAKSASEPTETAEVPNLD